jgi:NAD(P)-dependent dehydrogenase (short-subunit alcohol dehydrogenase family)
VRERSERTLAVVTGASRGIGAAIARALASTHDLVLVARTAEALEALRSELASAGGRVDIDTADLAVADDVQSLAQRLATRSPAVLVNNAGLAPSAPFVRTADDELARTLAVNLVAPFVLARALVPGMIARGHGRIVNVASTAALKGYRYTAAYSASKGGLVALTRALAAELANRGVTVNAVCPGFCDTDIVRDAVDRISATGKRSKDQALAELAAFNPQGRLVHPDEVATMVAYLCSSSADSVNGQALAIDGGETA